MRIFFGLVLASLAASLALAAGDYDQQGSGLRTVYDRAGNAINVANRTEEGRYLIDVANSDRLGGLHWSQVHGDTSPERASTFNVDSAGNVYIAGTRLAQGVKRMLLLKYSASGVLLWEQADDFRGCTAFNLTVTDNRGTWVGGSCATDSGYPVRVVHYSAGGDLLWGQQFDGGGRNYLRGLSVDFGGRAAAAVEVARGSLGGGNSFISTVVYDKGGGQLTTY
ncbi:MAG: hypothetical protein HY077_02805 [Elusimicrobia bacterium]|nr:hypothetical protein [Elusimicrobiota bacterium]